MGKKKKIDFVLFEDKWEKLIFRFYPKKSSCHSFGDNPPKSWDDVYKNYYSYAILQRWKDDNFTRVVFDCHCDECSVIDVVAAKIQCIVSGKKTIGVKDVKKNVKAQLLGSEIRPMGDGVSWTINESDKPHVYEIIMFDHDEIGYRFYLKANRLKEFGEYLNECCEYMLAHGDSI